MNPVTPDPQDGTNPITFAKNQPEYIPLPALVDQQGTVITEWELTEEEQERIFQGGHIRLTLMYAVSGKMCPACKATAFQPLSPVKIEILHPECGFSG